MLDYDKGDDWLMSKTKLIRYHSVNSVTFYEFFFSDYGKRLLLSDFKEIAKFKGPLGSLL